MNTIEIIIINTLTRQIVAIVFAIPAKFDVIDVLKLVLEVGIPNRTLPLNTTDPDSSWVGVVCNHRSSSPQSQMGQLRKRVVEL